MVAEGAALVESMDWTAGSIIEDGSAEAAGAEDAIVRAVLELPGGGQQREAEDALPLRAFSPRKQISSVNGSRRSSRQGKWTLAPKVAGAGPVPGMRSTVHIAKDLAAQQMRSAAQLLRCGRKRPALWAPYGIPPMDFRFYSIPSRSIAQQGGLSCAACAAAPPTEPLQGPPKA